MIVIVGVAHVIDLRHEIERIIVRRDPDIVAVELDYGRYMALKNNLNGTGRMPYMYRKMSEMQRSIADMLGTDVGQEMLTAVEIANLFGKEVAFVDMDAGEIARLIRKEMSLREKFRIYSSIIFAPFSRKKVSREDIEELLENEDKYIAYVREKFPGLSRALFDRREEHMASALLSLEKRGSVMVFVGDGHIPGLKKRIPHAEVVRLKELKNAQETQESDSMSFSFVLN